MAGFSLTVFDCLFVCHWESHWLILNEMHKVWTFASRKACIILCGVCFSSLENYFGLGTTNGKGKTDHPISLRSGIKSFEHFQRGEYFDCAFDLFVSCFRRLSPGWIKTRLYSVVSKYFFTCPDLFPLQNQLYPSLQSKNHFCAVKLSRK